MTSIGSFLLGVFVARSFGAASLGALAVVLFAYSTIQNASRGLATDPLLVRYSGETRQAWRRGTASATGVALLIGLAGGTLVFALGLVLLMGFGQHTLGWALLALAVGLPGLIVQDSWRFAFFASGQGAKAFTNDAVWTALLVGGLLIEIRVGISSVGWAVLAFGATASAAAVFGALQAQVFPRPERARAWLRRHRDLGIRFLVENLTLGLGGQIRSFAVAITAGLAAAGAIRGAEMMIAPAVTVLMGAAQVAVPEAVSALQRGYAFLRRQCWIFGAGLAGLSLLWGIFVVIVFPHGIGSLLLGSVWSDAFPLVAGVLVAATAGCLSVGSSAGLRALERADLSMRSQLKVTLITIGACTGGALLWGAQGAVWGAAGAAIVAAMIWGQQFARAGRDRAANSANSTAVGADVVVCSGHLPDEVQLVSGVRMPSGSPRVRLESTRGCEMAATEILLVTLMRSQGGSGVQSHVRTLRDYLDESGQPVSVVTPFSARSLLRTPVFAARYAIRPFSRTASTWWYRRWHAHYLERALRRRLAAEGENCTLYAQCPVSAEVALRVRTSQSVVMAAHFNISQADEWAGKGEIATTGRLFASIRGCENRILRALDGIIYVSHFSRDLLEERIQPLKDVPSAVVPNFVSEAEHKESPVIADLITVGALEPRKNHAFLLEVVAAAARRGHRYTLSLVGEGPESSSLQALAKRLGIAEQVRFYGYQADPRQLMSAHRLYCHTARMESFGIVLIEAMAEGLPVLTSAVGGIPEVVREGIDGEFWPLDCVSGAADVLISLMSDDHRIEAMKSAAIHRVRSEFSAECVCPRLVDLLRDMDKTARSRPRPGDGGPRGTQRSRASARS